MANNPMAQLSKQLTEQRELTRLITDLQTRCLVEEDTRVAFSPLLAEVIVLMESEYGFIGEILYDSNQKPYLKTFAISDISWDAESKKLYDENVAKGLEFRNLKNLFGFAILSQQPIISNNPKEDSRRGGLPMGHPKLNSFLGIPIHFKDQLIGFIGIANIKNGYREDHIEFLKPLCITIGQIIYSRRLIQERLAAEKAKEKLYQDYYNLANSTSALIWIIDPNYSITFCNSARLKFLGKNSIIECQDILAEIHEEDRVKFKEKIGQYFLNNKESFQIEYRLKNHQGEYRWILDECTPQFDLHGQWIGFIGHGIDITSLKRIQKSLIETKERLFETQELAKLGHWQFEIATDKIEWSPTLCSLYQIDVNNPPSRRAFIQEYIHPEDRPVVQQNYQKLLSHPNEIIYFDYRLKRKDGSIIWTHNKMLAQTDPDGQVTHILGVTQDITDRKNVEQALRESQELLEIAGEVAQVGGWDFDLRTNKIRWSAQTCRIHEVPLDYQPTLETAINFYAPESRDIIRKAVENGIKHGTPWHLELEFITATGKRIWVLASGRAEMKDGVAVRLYGAFQDITARKVAEQQQESLRNQLVQAQKMESVGRLAGGIAHDFNNMLSVIIGNCDLALEQLNPDHDIYNDLLEIKKSAHRSAELVRQLLAFARKQPTLPKIVNLNTVIEGIINLLRRLIGENIELKWQPAPDLPNIKIDPVQVDQLLTNLCINAKDAIDGSGRITISTEVQINPSNHLTYVLIKVSDTGIGIPPNVIDHIFEPFFTTKEVGRGTGLGLAMVYGIVEQNQGYITVQSEEGHGTTFEIGFPVIQEPETTSPDTVPTKITHFVPQTKKILLVEDEPSVLKMTQTILEKAGYEVYIAEVPSQALDFISDPTISIDLVLSDLVMPEMDGKQLMEKIRSLKPDIKYLYMSGYFPESLSILSNQVESDLLISKPFAPKDLLSRIEALLK